MNAFRLGLGQITVRITTTVLSINKTSKWRSRLTRGGERHASRPDAAREYAKRPISNFAARSRSSTHHTLSILPSRDAAARGAR